MLYVCAVIHVLAVVVGDVSCYIVVVYVSIELYNYEYGYMFIMKRFVCGVLALARPLLIGIHQREAMVLR
jgi:hypothetical protein